MNINELFSMTPSPTTKPDLQKKATITFLSKSGAPLTYAFLMALVKDVCSGHSYWTLPLGGTTGLT